jgi:hypothetical protein
VAPVIEELKNQSVFTGDKVVFRCGTLKSAMAHMAWYKLNFSGQDLENISKEMFVPIHLPYSDAKTLFTVTVEQVQDLINDPNSDEHSTNAADKQIEQLTIENATVNDAGVYVCIIGNGYTTRLSHAYLHVFSRDMMPIKKQITLINMLYIFLIVFVTLCIVTLAIIFYYKKSRRNYEGNNAPLKKGFESMKQNILYQYLPKKLLDKQNQAYYINDLPQNSNTMSSNDSANSQTKFIDSVNKIDMALIQSLFKDKEFNLSYET